MPGHRHLSPAGFALTRGQDDLPLRPRVQTYQWARKMAERSAAELDDVVSIFAVLPAGERVLLDTYVVRGGSVSHLDVGRLVGVQLVS